MWLKLKQSKKEKKDLVDDIGKLQSNKGILEKEKNDLLDENTKLKNKLNELLGKSAGEEYEKIKIDLIKKFVKKIDESSDNTRKDWKDEIIAKMSSFLKPEHEVESPQEGPTPPTRPLIMTSCASKRNSHYNI